MPRKTAHFDQPKAEVSSDSSIDKQINMGIEKTFKIVKKTATEAKIPFAISFMLSLSSSQLSSLQNIQHHDAVETDPLFISRDFRKSFD